MIWIDLAFGVWATLSRLELEYAGLNVGKNKFGFQFFFSFFFGPRIGLNPLTKKPCLVNELGRARGSGPGMEKPDPNPTCCHSYVGVE